MMMMMMMMYKFRCSCFTSHAILFLSFPSLMSMFHRITAQVAESLDRIEGVVDHGVIFGIPYVLKSLIKLFFMPLITSCLFFHCYSL